jgi:hypothetical protein
MSTHERHDEPDKALVSSLQELGALAEPFGFDIRPMSMAEGFCVHTLHLAITSHGTEA